MESTDDAKRSIIRYIVRYRSNGVTSKPKHNRNEVKPGIAGDFRAEEGDHDGAYQDALAAVEKAKKYFNENDTVETIINPEGGMNEAKEVRHKDPLEIIDIWVDKYRDGKLIESGDKKKCQGLESQGTEEIGTSSAEEKSPPTNTTESRKGKKPQELSTTGAQ